MMARDVRLENIIDNILGTACSCLPCVAVRECRRDSFGLASRVARAMKRRGECAHVECACPLCLWLVLA